MTFDEDAIIQTAKALNLSPDYVKGALEIWQTYRKYHRQNKQQRQQRQVRLLAQKQLEEEKQKYPERCFCLEEGFKVERDPENDEIIRYTGWYSPFDYNKQSPTQLPIYKCSRCGKEYHEVIAIA